MPEKHWGNSAVRNRLIIRSGTSTTEGGEWNSPQRKTIAICLKQWHARNTQTQTPPQQVCIKKQQNKFVLPITI